jgi:hypothetical protein
MSDTTNLLPFGTQDSQAPGPSESESSFDRVPYQGWSGRRASALNRKARRENMAEIRAQRAAFYAETEVSVPAVEATQSVAPPAPAVVTPPALKPTSTLGSAVPVDTLTSAVSAPTPKLDTTAVLTQPVSTAPVAPPAPAIDAPSIPTAAQDAASVNAQRPRPTRKI